MVQYNCGICGKCFKLKGDYARHINRKNPCEVTDSINNNGNQSKKIKKQKKKNFNIKNLGRQDENICEYCNQTFGRKSNLDRHKKLTCKMKDVGEKNIGLSVIMEYMKKMECELQKIRDDNKKILAKIDATNHIHNEINDSFNTTNIDKQINLKLKLVAFGVEDLKNIADDIYKRILSEGFQTVPRFIKYIHFNNEQPENHNVYISNMRNNHIVVYDGTEWKLTKKNEIIDKISDKKSCYSEDKYDEMFDTLGESAKKKFQQFLNAKDNEEIDKIKSDIKQTLCNEHKIS